MKLRKTLCVLLCALLCVVLLPSSLYAAEGGSITLHYESGVCGFDFYRIADFSEARGFTVIAPFDGYTESISSLQKLSSLDADEQRTLASTLEAVVKRDKLAATYSGKTDEQGNLVWSEAAGGIYLILGENTRDETYIYKPAPILVSIPCKDAAGAESNHAVVDGVKFEKEPLENHVSHKVLKLWKDEGNESKRPETLSVQLLRDGVLYETVVLNAENGWSYSWDKLSAGYSWSVVEAEVPKGYAMTVVKNGATFVLENTYEEETPPTPPGPPPEDQLPQTGQLWWPVPLMILLGLLLFGWGLLERRGGE